MRGGVPDNGRPEAWIATEDFPPKLGGISRWASNTALALSRLGWSVKVFAKRAESARPRDWIEVIQVPGRNFPTLRALHFARSMSRLRKAGAHPSIVFCSTWFVTEGALLAAPSCPVVCAVHGMEVFASLPPLAGLRRRAALERSSIAACASRFTAGRAASVAPRARIAIGINGVDTGLFRPGPPGFPGEFPVQLVTAGRMVPRKRMDLAIAVLQEAVGRGVDAGLWIAGEGPLETELRERAAHLGGRVRFLGPVDDESLAARYRSADLFISPCQSDERTGDVEGFGLTFVEAAACGAACAGLAEGGVPDAVLPGITGILCSREGFVSEAADLCGNPGLMESMGRRGAARAADVFDITGVIGNLAKAALENAGRA